MRSLNLFLSACLLGSLACGGGGGTSPATPPSPVPANTVSAILPFPPAATGGTYWVAYQDGQGPWKVLTGQPGGATTTYTFRVEDPAGRYGLAVVSDYPVGGATNGSYGMLEHFTLAEIRTLDYTPWAPTAKVSVNGTVSGLAPADGARVSTGRTTKNLNPGATGALLSASPGSTDFLAARLPGMGPADAVVALRGTPVSATEAVNLSFNFGTGWVLEPQSLTATGATAAETLALQVDWVIPSTTLKLASGSASPLAFNAVPTQRLLSGELHALSATAQNATAATLRTARAYSQSGATINLTLPTASAPMTLGPANGGAYYRPTATWTALPGALVHDLAFGDVYATLDWDVRVSSGWLGAGGTPSYTFPDFTGLSGWKSAWGLPFGRDLYWNLGERQTTYADPGFYFQGPRAYKAGTTAWETLSYGGVNVTPGSAPTPAQVPPDAAFRGQHWEVQGARPIHLHLCPSKTRLRDSPGLG